MAHEQSLLLDVLPTPTSVNLLVPVPAQQRQLDTQKGRVSLGGGLRQGEAFLLTVRAFYL